MRRPHPWLFLTLCVVPVVLIASQPRNYSFPATPKKATEETFFGQRIEDSYRWLENSQDPQVQAWVKSQNVYTRQWLDKAPGRSFLQKRLKEWLMRPSLSGPVIRGGHLFYLKRAGTRPHACLVMRAWPHGEEHILIDPALLDPEGHTTVDWFYPSKTGNLVAFGLSKNGNEHSVLHILDSRAQSTLFSETIAQTAYCTLTWKPDDSGFYYTRYLDPEKGDEPRLDMRRVYEHRLGTNPQQDVLIFGNGLTKEEWPEVKLSEDGHWLLFEVWRGWTETDLYWKRAETEVPAKVLVRGQGTTYEGTFGQDAWYVITNEKAPHRHIYKGNFEHPERQAWREVVAESSATLESVTSLRNHLLLKYIDKAHSRLVDVDEAKPLRVEIPLPAAGTAEDVSGDAKSTDAVFLFESFTIPQRLMRYDASAHALTLFDVSASTPSIPLIVEQRWVVSKDGTRIPFFLVRRDGLSQKHARPTLLTGYGGFGSARTPRFDPALLIWCEAGGVYAIANIRGGGEFGEAWHQMGILSHKQNGFDDFMAVAHGLIDQCYTNTDHLGIYGRSNGGLLIGAALTQAPELFGAAVAQVPLLDMLHYEKWRNASIWIPEYGSAEKEESFRWLIGYSPYQHVREGTHYPAVLLATGSEDSRVDPAHSRKMVARLQEVSDGLRPVLLREEKEAGHGPGKSFENIWREDVDLYSFLSGQLGLKFEE